MTFALILLIIGFIVAALGWAGTSILVGLLLIANHHPAGWGWLYIGLVIAGSYIHHRIVEEQHGVR